MRGRKLTILFSSATLLVSGWMTMCVSALPVVTVVGGGAALITGCSSDRSDSRQDARTGARTSERTENRVEDRHD
jgi:hypothetical protein